MNFAIANLKASQNYELVNLSDRRYAIFDVSTKYNQPMVAKADDAELAKTILAFLSNLPLGAKFPAMHDWNAL